MNYSLFSVYISIKKREIKRRKKGNAVFAADYSYKYSKILTLSGFCSASADERVEYNGKESSTASDHEFTQTNFAADWTGYRLIMGEKTRGKQKRYLVIFQNRSRDRKL